MGKFLVLILSLLFVTEILFSQENYDNFDGAKFQNFGLVNGILAIVTNPSIENINSSAKCAKYIRADTIQFDNIKIYPYRKLTDINPYATNTGTPPQFKIKVYTTAPIGTEVELQAGRKTDDNYPTGIHSRYLAITKVQYAWEELTFSFLEIPTGSLVAGNDIDKLVLFFSPSSFNRNTYYFDDLTGPELIPDLVSVQQNNNNTFELGQNIPNPAQERTSISYSTKTTDAVSLKLYNILGEEISTLVEQQQAEGNYTVTINTENLSKGIYFYVLRINNLSRTHKMVVSK